MKSKSYIGAYFKDIWLYEYRYDLDEPVISATKGTVAIKLNPESGKVGIFSDGESVFTCPSEPEKAIDDFVWLLERDDDKAKKLLVESLSDERDTYLRAVTSLTCEIEDVENSKVVESVDAD